MPLRDHMKLISTDDHVIEHPRVWSDRLPERYRQVGPRIVEEDDGGRADAQAAQVWEFEGRRYPQIGLNAVAGRPREEFGLEPTRFDELRPGCYDPVEPRARTWTSTASRPSCASRRSRSSPERCSCRPTTRSWRSSASAPTTTSSSTSGAEPHPTG